MRHRTLLLAVLSITAVSLLVLPARPAQAHTGSQSYVYLSIFEDGITGNVQYPIADVNEVLGLDISEDRGETEDSIAQHVPELQRYTLEHFDIGDGTRSWDIEFTGFRALELPAGSYVILEFDVVESLNPVPREFTVAFDGIMHAKADRDALLLIGQDLQSGTFSSEGEPLLRYTPDNAVQVVSLAETSWLKNTTAIIGLGVEHIRIGSDHILFVLALVLPAVLVFRRPEGWLPAPTFTSSLWRVLKIVTMFTIAHSITLALGGLGIIELPARMVEAVIAISIAIAALHNIRPVVVNKEWLLAFGFGLFHGFGFAGLLSDLGLDRGNRIASLLGFNVGIELGQMVIILLVFPGLFLIRRTRAYLKIMNVGSALLAIAALGWAYERVFDTSIGVSSIIDPILDWPSSLWFAAGGTVIAAVLYWYDRSRTQLLPVLDDQSIDEDDREPVTAG